jgi:hypothetical protein
MKAAVIFVFWSRRYFWSFKSKSNQIIYSPPTRYIQNAKMQQYYNQFYSGNYQPDTYIAFNPRNLDCVKKEKHNHLNEIQWHMDIDKEQ